MNVAAWHSSKESSISCVSGPWFSVRALVVMGGRPYQWSHLPLWVHPAAEETGSTQTVRLMSSTPQWTDSLHLFSFQVVSGEPQYIVFTIPIFELLPSQYYIKAVSDRWIGAESVCIINFQNLILPDRHPPHTGTHTQYTLVHTHNTYWYTHPEYTGKYTQNHVFICCMCMYTVYMYGFIGICWISIKKCKHLYHLQDLPPCLLLSCTVK